MSLPWTLCAKTGRTCRSRAGVRWNLVLTLRVIVDLRLVTCAASAARRAAVAAGNELEPGVVDPDDAGPVTGPEPGPETGVHWRSGSCRARCCG